MFRLAALVVALVSMSWPVCAQTLTFGVGSGDGSSATVTTTQALPSFDGPFSSATVLSGVNVRNLPTSHGSTVIATLHEGDVVTVRCKFGWCQLADDGGYTAQKFLSLDGSAESFDVVPAPGDGAVSSGDAPAVASSTDANLTASFPANFDGLWTVVDPAGKPGMPLILKQTDTAVTGTLQSPNRLAKITGDIAGSKLTFTYDMLNKAGKTIASGNGFFNLGKGGTSLSGVLMLNGLVISNVNATR